MTPPIPRSGCTSTSNQRCPVADPISSWLQQAAGAQIGNFLAAAQILSDSFGVQVPGVDYEARGEHHVARVPMLGGAHPQIDEARLAYVAHDFGAMYGAVLAGVDPRPQWYVLMAGTPVFSDWLRCS